MGSGVEDLYGKTKTPVFCKCFSDEIVSGEAPFSSASKCAKPIIERMLFESNS